MKKQFGPVYKEGLYVVSDINESHIGAIRALTKEELVDKLLLASNTWFPGEFTEVHTRSGFERLEKGKMAVFTLSGDGEREETVYVHCSKLY